MYKQDLALNNLQGLICSKIQPTNLFMGKGLGEYMYPLFFFGPVGRVFANGPGDQGSIPGCIIPKTLKMVLDTSFLNTQKYKVHIKSKVEQSRERSSSYWKGSLLVALDYSRQLYLLILNNGHLTARKLHLFS